MLHPSFRLHPTITINSRQDYIGYSFRLPALMSPITYLSQLTRYQCNNIHKHRPILTMSCIQPLVGLGQVGRLPALSDAHPVSCATSISLGPLATLAWGDIVVLTKWSWYSFMSAYMNFLADFNWKQEGDWRESYFVSSLRLRQFIGSRLKLQNIILGRRTYMFMYFVVLGFSLSTDERLVSGFGPEL